MKNQKSEKFRKMKNMEKWKIREDEKFEEMVRGGDN